MAVFLLVFMLLPIVDAVMEQVRDSNNVISWKLGTYRNRNVIPMPPGLDLLEKKHKRRDVEERTDNDPDAKNTDEKKSFIRVQRKGKKSEIPLSEKLVDTPQSQYAPALQTEASLASRSKVSKTWGMTWEDPHPNPELYRDTSGSERSTLTAADGVKKNGKISEKEFDSGLMGRGLGGMTERAQNENLMEEKFEEQIEDEKDVALENSRRARPRDKVIRIPSA